MADPADADRTVSPARAWEGSGSWTDIRYETAEAFPDGDGGGRIAKITIDRPEVRNAFRPHTVEELTEAFTLAREDPDVGVVVLAGEGPLAFCSDGDQRARGYSG
ncbi:MAG: enoyl-CoA hydratase-related protein, partial [Iamia sp.]